jgi:hypothetical protein
MTFPPADLFQQLLQAGSADWQAQGVMRMSASRRGKDEIFMTPLNGVYMAMMTKTAPETAAAQTTSVTNTVLLRGAKSPKLTKIAVSHATTTSSRGSERGPNALEASLGK